MSTAILDEHHDPHHPQQYFHFEIPEISVIIPCFRRVEWLSRCLQGLAAQDIHSIFQVVIIDDGSPNEDEIRGVVQELNAPNYRLCFARKANAGPASARNYGVRLSTGIILCFLDDDSVPEPGWLRSIVMPFVKDNNVALVSGKIVSYYSEGLSAQLERAVYNCTHWATCNIAYRRDVFLELGEFDEQFPEASWEDNDLGLRARWGGFIHVMAADAIVKHPHEQSWGEFREKCVTNGRGAARFCVKWLKNKPLWAIATPLLMARRLLYGLNPLCWLGSRHSIARIRFFWSWYSLKGFLGVFLETNQTR
jgi:GT2 family glycosyltransferase